MEFSGTWRNMAEYGRLPSDCRLVVSLWLLSRWKQVDVYKVSRGCPVTGGNNIKLSIDFSLTKLFKSLMYKRYGVLVLNCNSVKSSIVNAELNIFF